MKERIKIILQIVIAIIGVVTGLLVVNAFNQYVLMNLPFIWRMVLMIVVYWLIAVVPVCIMIFAGDKLTDYGFSKERIAHYCQLSSLMVCTMR